MKRIAINGLGRIGRNLTRKIFQNADLELVAINDLMPIDMAIYFLKYDSTYGASNLKIEKVADDLFVIENQKIQYSSIEKIEDLDWGNLEIDIAINCSGTNKSKPLLSKYKKLGIHKTILSSPPINDDIPIVLFKFNSSCYRGSSHSIISNASCTTYSIIPILDILSRNYDINYLNFTTIHCYTSDQNLQDGFHRNDLRRARAASNNIIPTTTSATKVVKSIFPELSNKISGSSFRVPVINGSMTELIFQVKESVNTSDIQALIKKEIEEKYSGVLDVTNDAVVSSDIIGNKHAGVIDNHSILVIDNHHIKLNVLYDNESGYSAMLLALINELNV